MRNIVILILIIVALAVLRSLIFDVGRAVSKVMGDGKKPGRKSEPSEEVPRTGRLARDPHTGVWVDEAAAISADVDGVRFFFESEASRDAYLSQRRDSRA
jgi:hypothetical protein